MSVLAHVVDHFSLSAEPVASQSLAHILKSNADIASVFVNKLMPEGNFQPGLVKAELGNEGGQPDLTIHDNQGGVRTFVENKFWAGLTENQPVNYLHALPEGGTLLFIVPQQRVNTVWNELLQRCITEGHNTQQDGNSTCAHVLGKTMRITSWTNVLTVLQDAAQHGSHRDIQCDILQLQGLTSRMDNEAFLPIRPDELTDQEVSRRLVNYSDLIEPITSRLVGNQVANTRSANFSATLYTAGRYLRVFLPQYLGALEHQYGVWLGVDLKLWSTHGITPLWLELNLNYDFANVTGDPGQIQAHFIHEKFHGVQNVDGVLCFPIRIKPGVERDEVIGDAVDQITYVVNILHNLNKPG